MSGENRTLLHSDTLLPQCCKHFLNVSATGRGQGLLGGVSWIGPAPAGTLSSLSSLTQRRVGVTMVMLKAVGIRTHVPTFFTDSACTSPQSPFSRMLCPMRSSLKSGLVVKHTRALTSYKVLMGLVAGQPWCESPAHIIPFALFLAQYHFVFFLF